MFSEARKLHLIEEVLRIENEHTLVALEALIKDTPENGTASHSTISDFAGIWSEEEADEISLIINATCEQMNPSDWK